MKESDARQILSKMYPPRVAEALAQARVLLFFFIALDLELSDTKVYEP